MKLFVSEHTAKFWRTPLLPPKDKVAFMIMQVLTYPQNHTPRERRFWLSPFLCWQVKHLYAVLQYGIIGNADANAFQLELEMLIAMAGYHKHVRLMNTLVQHMMSVKMLGAKLTCERPPMFLGAITPLNDLPQHYLAPPEMLETIMDNVSFVRGKRKGEIGHDFMQGVLLMAMAGRKRILTPEQYDLRRKAIRLRVAERLGVILREMFDEKGDDKGEDNDDGGQEAPVGPELVTV